MNLSSWRHRLSALLFAVAFDEAQRKLAFIRSHPAANAGTWGQKSLVDGDELPPIAAKNKKCCSLFHRNPD